MKLYLDTVSQDVTFPDLDGFTVYHPTVGLEVTAAVDLEDIAVSADFWTAVTNGIIVVYDERGLAITDPSQVEPAAIQDIKQPYANVTFAGGQNLNDRTFLNFGVFVHNSLGITMPASNTLVIQESGMYYVHFQLYGYKGIRRNISIQAWPNVNFSQRRASVSVATAERNLRTYVRIANAHVLRLNAGDEFRIQVYRSGQGGAVWIRPANCYLILRKVGLK